MSKQAGTGSSKSKTKETLLEEQKDLVKANRSRRDGNQIDEAKELSEKEKLIDQNIKLKTQIYDLSRQLDEIMGKEQAQKKKYGIRDDEDDETIKEKKIELKKQQLEIMSLKNKIYAIKRQLETVFNNRALVAKEDELKYLRNELEALEEEKKGLIKIKNEQTRVLKVGRNEQQYQQKIEEMKKQLHLLKQQSKSLNEKLMQSQRVLRKNHEQYLLKQSKVKQLEQKLQNNQTKSRIKKPIQSVTPEMIESLEEEVGRLEQQRKQTQKTWYDKINAIDLELREKKNQEEKKLMLLKEKEKELKLNQLKIKELRKLIKCNMADSNGKDKLNQDLDFHQFRYKRNIKHLRE